MEKSEYRFIEQHQKKWAELDHLIHKRNKSFNDINRLGELYLEATEDLSYTQTHLKNSQTLIYLNNLVRKCHQIFYKNKKPRVRQFIAFIITGFPKLLYSLRRPILLSLSIFLFANLFAFSLVSRNPELAEIFLDSNTYQMIRSDLELRKQFGNFDQIPADERPALSLLLWFNNSKVAVTAFVFGITLGIGSVIILLFNGFMLGSLIAVYYLNGQLTDFLSLIMVHGSIELTAIVIAGGAAFHLASAVIAPGRRKRTEIIKEKTRTALLCIFGVVALLLWAGLIEAFITPMKLPVPIRVTIASVNLTLLALYTIIGFFMNRRDTNLPPVFEYSED